jgi:REP element-mobilizing transposase RayT
MPRPPRIDFADALYHVTSRGNGRADIYWSDDDRSRFLRQLGDGLQSAGVLLYAYVLMPNHRRLLPWPRGDGDLDEGPLPLQRDWRRHVQSPQAEGEPAALRQPVVRGSPLSGMAWQERAAKRLHLESTLRARGRPRKIQSSALNEEI